MIKTVGSIKDEMITPNERLNLIFLKWNDETRQFEKYLRTLKVKICYGSLLEENWLVTDTASSILTSSCESPIEKVFGL